MEAPYNPSQPIKLLFDQFDNAIELAAAANAAESLPTPTTPSSKQASSPTLAETGTVNQPPRKPGPPLKPIFCSPNKKCENRKSLPRELASTPPTPP
jgi:hypothetical protein